MPNSKLKHYLVEMVCVDFHLGLLVLLCYKQNSCFAGELL
jgi:hypothetical protein